MKRPFHDVPPIVTRSVDPSERRVALVIGNGRYVKEKDVLANPPNDARDMAEALTRIGFFGVKADGDDFTVDTSGPGVTALIDLDQRQLGKALAAMARATEGVRQAIIYYAGHGIEVDGENYLIPIDAKLAHTKDADFETQPLTRVLRTIEGASGLGLVILDACRNNPFRARLFRGRDVAGGLRGIEPPGNVLVAYAAKHGTFASDGKNSKNSPFAAALLSHIEKPGLEVVELFREVKDDVRDATEGGQEPYLYGSLGRRREYFVPPIPIELPPALAPKIEPPLFGPVDERTLEHTYWQDVKSSTDAAEFEAFLAKFPNGTFAGLAHERAKAAIDATTAPNALRRVLQRYPESPRARRMKKQLATLEWARLRKSRNKDELSAFAIELAGLPEADLARARAAALEKSGRRGSRWPWIAGGTALVALIAALTLLHQGSQTDLPTVKAEVIDPAKIAAAEPKAITEAPTPQASIKLPQMVVVPAGSYKRGSEDFDDEKPVKTVTIKQPFEVGKFEVTFDEWAACAAGGGCTDNKTPSDEGWGKDNRPVINVSWNDINDKKKGYIAWLNKTTGRTYRLLTEAEWEYAARGVKSASEPHTNYPWGNDIGKGNANCGGCGSQWDNKQTAPVDSFGPNKFGLYNMHGNVWEWVEDTWHANYDGAPLDGSVWTSGGDTSSRVLRGGSWGGLPQFLRSAYRDGGRPDIRYWNVGFRLARTLNP